jgi:hypothetical protein
MQQPIVPTRSERQPGSPIRLPCIIKEIVQVADFDHTGPEFVRVNPFVESDSMFFEYIPDMAWSYTKFIGGCIGITFAEKEELREGPPEEEFASSVYAEAIEPTIRRALAPVELLSPAVHSKDIEVFVITYSSRTEEDKMFRIKFTDDAPTRINTFMLAYAFSGAYHLMHVLDSPRTGYERETLHKEKGLYFESEFTEVEFESPAIKVFNGGKSVVCEFFTVG